MAIFSGRIWESIVKTRYFEMSFSLAENPGLVLGGALLLCFALVISIKFVRNRDVKVKANNGSAAVNGQNSGNITINTKKEK